MGHVLLERNKIMGMYLNPAASLFERSLQSEIYVDKSGLIAKVNAHVNTQQNCLCISRPRRFGKSMAANMLSAYYCYGEDTHHLFADLFINTDQSYQQHRNQYDVLMINMQEFLSRSETVTEMLELLQLRLLHELREAYQVSDMDMKHLDWGMEAVFAVTKRPFVILIDEWDCLFREYQDNTAAQKQYLDFLRIWLKDRRYVGLAYMTGILPIKKYGTHSALNMFTEYSVSDPGELASFFGFTEEEISELCSRYHISEEEMKAWYNGYTLYNHQDGSVRPIAIYSPRSVIESILRRNFSTYWNQTETYEALKVYIQMNYDGLKEKFVAMMAGAHVPCDISGFANDMTSFRSSDDVLALLIHLGYLTYDEMKRCVFIPNKEVGSEYVTTIKRTDGWGAVSRSVEYSKRLLEALWNLDCAAVATGIDLAHQEVSVLQYNDENALSYTISLAFYYAREYYTLVREMPAGKGFADICLIPRALYADKPAVVIELKWDRSALGAIAQIKERKYTQALSEYRGNLLLVGIYYDRKNKIHHCEIERA